MHNRLHIIIFFQCYRQVRRGFYLYILRYEDQRIAVRLWETGLLHFNSFMIILTDLTNSYRIYDGGTSANADRIYNERPLLLLNESLNPSYS